MDTKHALAETMDLGKLPQLWDSLNRMERQMVRARAYADSNSKELTDRLLDAGAPGGERLYLIAGSLIAAARDHQGLIQDMTRTGMRPHAAWSPVRAAFETATMACWILEPDDATERRYRGLRVAFDDQRAVTTRLALQRKMAEHSESRAEVLAAAEKEEEADKAQKVAYNEEARALGRQATPPKVNLTDELPNMKCLKEGEAKLGPMYQMVWRLLSGVLHGDMGAILMTNGRRGERRIKGGVETTLVLDDRMFETLAGAAGVVQMTAMELYERRSTRLTKP